MGTKWLAALVEADRSGLEPVARAARAFAKDAFAKRSTLSMLAAPTEAPGSRLWALGWSLGPPSKRVDSYDARPDLAAVFARLAVERRSKDLLERLRDELLVDLPAFGLAVLASAALGQAWFVGRLEIVGYQAFVELRNGRVHEGTVVYRGDGPHVVELGRGRARVRTLGEDEELDPDDDGLAALSDALSGVDVAIDAFYEHAYHVEWPLRGPRARAGLRPIEHGSRDALAPPEPVLVRPRARSKPRKRPKLAPFADRRKEWAWLFRSDVTSYRQLATWKVTGAADQELRCGLLVLYSGEDDELARRFLTRCIRAAKLADDQRSRHWRARLLRARSLHHRTLATLLLGRSSRLEPFRGVATGHYGLVTEEPGPWSEFDEEDYLVALRAALILGDLELYAAMPPRRKRLARQAKEQELLARLAIDPGDPHLARSFRTFLDEARKPSRLAEARVLELAALYDKYFVSRDGTIDWVRAISHVVGSRRR